jgi:hypothetical protein
LTLAGGEVGEVLLHMIATHGIEAYVFHRDHSAHPRYTASIQPPSDPLVAFLDHCKQGAWDAPWQDAVNQVAYRFGQSNVPVISNQRTRAAVFEGYRGLQLLAPYTP